MRPPPLLLDARRATWHAGLWAVIYMIVAGASAVALLADPRTLPSGDPVALKPLKFAVSFVVHCATLWLLGVWTRRAEARDGWFALGVWVTIAALLAETGPIFTQALRGVPSHFNVDTAFDRTMFTIMGLGTLGLVLAAGLMLIGLARRPGGAAPLARAATALGIGVMLLGGATGVMMVQPTAEQAAALASGLGAPMIGAHAVGAAEGPVLPLFGWSLVAGDWRAPHFIGVHGFQALPLIAFGLLRLGGAGRPMWGAFWMMAAIYMALFAWAIFRTAQGRSLFLLDGATVAVGSTLAAAAALAAWVSMRGRRARGGLAR